MTTPLPATAEQRQRERLPTDVYADPVDASRALADEIEALIRERAEAGKPVVLGLATGSTPLGLYRELIRRHREEGLSFAHVHTFNLDEYFGLSPTHPESYAAFMRAQLFDHLDIPPTQTHLPNGTVSRDEVFAHSQAYEDAIAALGGIDLQVLGIGRTGHIGFNEPGSGPHTRTRLINLDHLTRQDAARDFQGEGNVPRQAITMGVGTICDARRIRLLAWGQAKSAVLARAIEQAPDPALPASLLQGHDDVRFLLDTPAAAALTRFRQPWRVGPVKWNRRLVRRAVDDLSADVGKPILKLVEADYTEHGLAELLVDKGNAYNLNIGVFNDLQHTITGWPGGKPKVDDTHRPERAAPHPKRVLVLPPEPLDDVLHLGGTLHRLVDQGHEVTVAYLTSGNLAVADGDAINLAETLLAWCADTDPAMAARARAIMQACAETRARGEGTTLTAEVRALKGIIRRREALSALATCGLPRDRVRFLDLPFYEAGRYRRFTPATADEAQLTALLRELQPHQLFLTGSDADPSSLEGVVFRLFARSWAEVSAETWAGDCWRWLYRGSGAEWVLDAIDMAVPLSPDELRAKGQAIACHQSQLTQSPVRDPAHRDVWPQIEALNRHTAERYDRLGLAEYEAVEAFSRLTEETS